MRNRNKTLYFGLLFTLIGSLSSCSESNKKKDETIVLKDSITVLKDSIANLWDYVDGLEKRVFGEASSSPNAQKNITSAVPKTVYVFSAIVFNQKKWSLKEGDHLEKKASLTQISQTTNWSEEIEYRILDKHQSLIMDGIDFHSIISRKCYVFDSYEKASEERYKMMNKIQEGVDIQ